MYSVSLYCSEDSRNRGRGGPHTFELAEHKTTEHVGKQEETNYKSCKSAHTLCSGDQTPDITDLWTESNLE